MPAQSPHCEASHLTAALPAAVGYKFNLDGTVKQFPGNTIVCAVEPTSWLMAALTDAGAALASLDLDGQITPLPPPSFHMTLFEGVCDRHRVPERWPRDLPLDCPLDDVTAHFLEALRDFRLATALPFRLRTTAPNPAWGPVVLALEPIDADENARMRSLRDRLTERLQLRTPVHDSYTFHITLAYAIRWPSVADEVQLRSIYDRLRSTIDTTGPVEIGAPAFCTFDDMFAFPPVVPLAP